jgi:hypothetical protein
VRTQACSRCTTQALPGRRHCERHAREHIIRDGQEMYVLRLYLSAAELADVEERRRSREARKRFGIQLRRVRAAEDAEDRRLMKEFLQQESGSQSEAPVA